MYRKESHALSALTSHEARHKLIAYLNNAKWIYLVYIFLQSFFLYKTYKEGTIFIVYHLCVILMFVTGITATAHATRYLRLPTFDTSKFKNVVTTTSCVNWTMIVIYTITATSLVIGVVIGKPLSKLAVDFLSIFVYYGIFCTPFVILAILYCRNYGIVLKIIENTPQEQESQEEIDPMTSGVFKTQQGFGARFGATNDNSYSGQSGGGVENSTVIRSIPIEEPKDTEEFGFGRETLDVSPASLVNESIYQNGGGVSEKDQESVDDENNQDVGDVILVEEE